MLGQESEKKGMVGHEPKIKKNNAPPKIGLQESADVTTKCGRPEEKQIR